MTVISSRNTGQSALIDLAGHIANDAIRLSERHRKVKLASRLFSGGTLGVAVALAIMGVWHYFARPSTSFGSIDVPAGILDAARQAASTSAAFGSPFDAVASVLFSGPVPMILAGFAIAAGIFLALVRQTLTPLVSAGALAFMMFIVPQMFGAILPSGNGENSSSATVAAPAKPAEWQAWLKDHPEEASTDGGRYVAAQVAYLNGGGALKSVLSTWPGTLSAASGIDPSRIVIMERRAFNEARSSMAKSKLADYQHTRDRLRAASSSAALWLAALLVGTLVTRRLRKTMGARVESAMGYLASRKARA